MEKKNMMKRMYLVFVSLMLLISFTGCGEGGTGKKLALAVVTGVHSNSYELPLNAETISSMLYDVCYSYGRVSFVNVDGNPYMDFETSIPEPSVSGLSDQKKKDLAEGYTAQLKETLHSLAARTEETDPLKAIRIAAQSLRAADPAVYSRTMLILDSGIPTAGCMNAQNGLLYAGNIDEIVDKLLEMKEIPDLTDMDVIWSFCGEAAPPQQPLSEKDKDKLRSIWEAILKAGGAKSVTFTDDSISHTPYTGLPKVSIVDTEVFEIIVDKPKKQEQVIRTYTLDEAHVRFVGDQAIFTDEQKARASIQEVADMLNAHPENTVYIVGTTASGNVDFCDQLSRKRAEVVRDVLMEMGISADRMQAVGLGFRDPWHLTDIDAEGNWIEKNAACNRKVMIVDQSSEEASLLGL